MLLIGTCAFQIGSWVMFSSWLAVASFGGNDGSWFDFTSKFCFVLRVQVKEYFSYNMPKVTKASAKKLEPLWFVIDCKNDDSVCLVSESHVIYGDNLNRGDTVKFFMSSKSKELTGIVEDFSRK